MIDTFGKIADQILVDMMKRYVSDIEIIMKMNDILTPEERVQEETNKKQQLLLVLEKLIVLKKSLKEKH